MVKALSSTGMIPEHPHALDAEEVIDTLSSRLSGLTDDESRQRLEKFGPNELPEFETVSPFLLFLKQFKSWLVIVLLIASVISWFANQVFDAWIIMGVVMINILIGFLQEYRAEKAIASLRKMITKTAKVMRNAELYTVPSFQLVPGDIIVLEEGDSIPADSRIIESKNVRTIEASLTGESLPVSKNPDTLKPDTSVADRKNMMLKSTFVAGGYAKAIVTGTGVNTAIGEISESIGEIKTERTNFMKKTDVLARQMFFIAIFSASFIFLAGYFISGIEINEILLMSIAALVAAVPEGLPAIISIVLAIGANRMAKRNAVIREFTATETLGAIDTILTDKTGTLTQNSLTARKIFIYDYPEYKVSGQGWFPAGNFTYDDTVVEPDQIDALQKLLKIAVVSNNSEIRQNKKDNQYELIGDPTEGALTVLGRKGGLHPDSFRDKKSDDLPFDSHLKYRASIYKENGEQELFVTGAPEKLLKMSNQVLSKNGEQDLMEDIRKAIDNKISQWSDDALRIIALAYKKYDKNNIDTNDIGQLVFAGIVGMIDPPRADAKEAVEKCKNAGIRVVMLTGDHANTAVAIAKTVGIVDEEKENEVVALTEQQLLELTDKEFEEAIQTVPIFARLTPKMKLRIATTLQAGGYLIAMTGDGVNDAPALKKADVGIAMGIMGTDVSKDAADMVLADDNFATIVNAIEEGRIVFTNARQTSFFLITTNIAESITLVTAIALGLPIPLTATQILWLNLVTDGITGIALATEPGHGEIMRGRPLKGKENILNKAILPFLIINVTIMASLSLSVFYYYMSMNVEVARTALFVVMAFTQLFNVFNLRSIPDSVFKIGLFSNKYVNLAVAVSAGLLIAVTRVPILSNIFHFGKLPLFDFLILFGFSSSILWAGEIYKFVRKKTPALRLNESNT